MNNKQYITNVDIITGDAVLKDHAILLEGDRIKDILPMDRLENLPEGCCDNSGSCCGSGNGNGNSSRNDGGGGIFYDGSGCYAARALSTCIPTT